MVRSVRWAVGAVLFLAVFGLVATLALKLPVVLQMEVTRRLAPDCEPPSESDLPANVGRRVVLDVRENGSGDTLISTALSDWVPMAMSRIAPPGRVRDLVFYAHGFNTNVTDASCVGQVLRADLAQLPQYRQQDGPDVVVFSWPGEFGIFGFSKAQGSATRAARYLASVIREMSGRRIYLVGHSLGSKVVMEAVSALGSAADAHPVDGILLVEGAIPATSVRTWKSAFTASFPTAQALGLNAKPIVEEDSGTGEYVAAAALAAHVVITTARWDTVLGQAYSLDELFAPDSPNRPKVPASVGIAPRTLPQTRAIGSPFPSSPVYVRHEHKMNDPNRYVPGNYPGGQQSLPPYRPVDSFNTYQVSEWKFVFSVPHTSFHEFQTDKWWWGPFRYRHAPLHEPLVRRDVLTRAWAIYDPTGQKR